MAHVGIWIIEEFIFVVKHKKHLTRTLVKKQWLVDYKGHARFNVFESIVYHFKN
jgi:hypothetical protein